MKNILIVGSFLFLTCCTNLCTPSRESMSPEQVVQKYLDTSINMKDPSEKAILLDLTTGVLHASINTADDDMVRQAFINKRYRLESYAVVERRDRTPRETEITFEIIYFDETDGHTGKDAPKTTTENTVALLREDGVWRLRDVIGKKTSLEFFVEDEVIKPVPGVPGAETATETDSVPK